ncbi:MAG: hypothetical protein A2189_04125 [Paenibacillus sp. RIFOXYA1_FULL_44_5]|nr:MAG: hypothetical protein A2189_04125 [Paenibacillus sp. RIFOXYA1_FULL_44_5]
MSNLIKAKHYVALEDEIKIIVKPQALPKAAMEIASTSELAAPLTEADLQEIMVTREQLIQEAEQYVAQLIAQAKQEAEQLREHARGEADQWWKEKREEDEAHRQQAIEAGFQAGYEKGVEQARLDVQQQYQNQIEEAISIVEQAVSEKTKIIASAEPFLIDLSCAVAEKIIGFAMQERPEWLISQIRTLLVRKKEGGVITLCVCPSQYSFINNAREELSLAVDSQTELQIVPDLSVHENGCMIRSAYGSIDARVETQLDEIKKALLIVASGKGEHFEHDTA